MYKNKSEVLNFQEISLQLVSWCGFLVLKQPLSLFFVLSLDYSICCGYYEREMKKKEKSERKASRKYTSTDSCTEEKENSITTFFCGRHELN